MTTIYHCVCQDLSVLSGSYALESVNEQYAPCVCVCVCASFVHRKHFAIGVPARRCLLIFCFTILYVQYFLLLGCQVLFVSVSTKTNLSFKIDVTACVCSNIGYSGVDSHAVSNFSSQGESTCLAAAAVYWLWAWLGFLCTATRLSTHSHAALYQGSARLRVQQTSSESFQMRHASLHTSFLSGEYKSVSMSWIWNLTLTPLHMKMNTDNILNQIWFQTLFSSHGVTLNCPQVRMRVWVLVSVYMSALR